MDPFRVHFTGKALKPPAGFQGQFANTEMDGPFCHNEHMSKWEVGINLDVKDVQHLALCTGPSRVRSGGNCGIGEGHLWASTKNFWSEVRWSGAAPS